MTTYFITICAHMQRNLFQRDQVAGLMVATFLKYRDAEEFELHEYVVMPNHIHLLLSLNPQQQLGRVIQLIKGGFSHSLGNNGITFNQVWQQRYYARRVRDANEFAAFSEYIRQNPVRKGLVATAEEFSYSSAGQSTEVPGLKPLSINTGAEREPEGSLYRGVKAGGREPEGSLYGELTRGDTNLKVRSTSPES